MGYSTTLYAVDLDELQSAVGSDDAALFDRVRQLAADGSGEVDATRGPRVRVTLDGDILFNGRRVSLDEFRAAVSDPEWKGTNLHLYREPGRRWRPGPSAFELSQAAGPRTVAGVLTCNTEEEFLAGWRDDDISEEQALRELLAGTFTRPDCASRYGYALERLCRAIGVRLGTISGKGRLKALKLGTPLGERRSPIRLPTGEDFPIIGYLTAEEVLREVGRLGAMDLSYPGGVSIERDRHLLYGHLRSADHQGRAVVTFYY